MSSLPYSHSSAQDCGFFLSPAESLAGERLMAGTAFPFPAPGALVAPSAGNTVHCWLALWCAEMWKNKKGNTCPLQCMTTLSQEVLRARNLCLINEPLRAELVHDLRSCNSRSLQLCDSRSHFWTPWGHIDLTIASISFPIENDSITKQDYPLVLIKWRSQTTVPCPIWILGR